MKKLEKLRLKKGKSFEVIDYGLSKSQLSHMEQSFLIGGVYACAGNGCGGDACVTDACGGNACGGDGCLINACGGNACPVQLCPIDACSVDGCWIDAFHS